MALVTQ